MPLTELFAGLGLRRSGTTAIDVDRLVSGLDQRQPEGLTTLQTLARALSGVVAAAVALTDPEQVVLGGPWGRDPRVQDAVTAYLETTPRPVTVRASAQTAPSDHQGARLRGLSELRTSIATDT